MWGDRDLMALKRDYFISEPDVPILVMHKLLILQAFVVITEQMEIISRMLIVVDNTQKRGTKKIGRRGRSSDHFCSDRKGWNGG